MKLCLIVNDSKPLALQFAGEFQSEAQKKGCDTYAYLGFVEKDTDFAVVFGGDGTILKFIRGENVTVPVLGINCGNKGFLAESGKSASDYIDLLLSGSYLLDERRFLKVECAGEEFYALNEVVLGRAETINLMNVSVATDVGLLEEFRADGVIVASPTGSTAYSLSAGGPVLSPRVPAFVVTPVCPHDLQSRPIVLPEEDRVKISAASAGKCAVVVDGIMVAKIEDKAEISVTIADRKVSFVRTDKRSFYKIMLSKFTKGN